MYEGNEPDGKRDRRIVGERIQIDGAELFLLVTPSLVECLPDELTKAEKAVAALVLEGRSNQEIARVRGTSVRTVANQVASIFRKLEVTARAELGQAILDRRSRRRNK